MTTTDKKILVAIAPFVDAVDQRAQTAEDRATYKAGLVDAAGFVQSLAGMENEHIAEEAVNRAAAAIMALHAKI